MDGMWEGIKALGSLVYLPVLAGLAWLFRKYDAKIDDVSTRINMVESNHRVIELKVDSFKEVVGINMTHINNNIHALTTSIDALVKKIDAASQETRK